MKYAIPQTIREMQFLIILIKKFHIRGQLNINILKESNLKTVVTTEYPMPWSKGKVAYYPVNDEKKIWKFLRKYEDLAENKENVIFGGRLEDTSTMICGKPLMNH